MLKGTLLAVGAAIIHVWMNKYQGLTGFGKFLSIFLFILCGSLYAILDMKDKKSETYSDNSDDDVFFDNAPNPTPPPTNPPTSEQIEFAEFMKKQREQEREKSVVRREWKNYF